ncbi:hypothetical protein CVT24_012409, partial [Panaeolus cyanescens]
MTQQITNDNTTNQYDIDFPPLQSPAGRTRTRRLTRKAMTPYPLPGAANPSTKSIKRGKGTKASIKNKPPTRPGGNNDTTSNEIEIEPMKETTNLVETRSKGDAEVATP